MCVNAVPVLGSFACQYCVNVAEHLQLYQQSPLWKCCPFYACGTSGGSNGDSINGKSFSSAIDDCCGLYRIPRCAACPSVVRTAAVAAMVDIEYAFVASRVVDVNKKRAFDEMRWAQYLLQYGAFRKTLSCSPVSCIR